MSILNKLFRKHEVAPGEQGPLYPQVREAIVDVQAYARSHGGEIHLLGVTDDGDVRIKLTGACNGCPMSGLTLKHGIEEQLKVLVPGVGKIIQV